MNSENAIEVKDIKKRFKVYMDKGNSMKEKMLFKNRNRYEDRWVLKGISFDIKKGEAVGLIGKNGCGKSTTLKMLTRIMYPSEGSIELKGRISSLIELGAGFHPDMSGRENIFTNASIFGLNHSEIERRLEEIIKFSELEEFIDNPVRTYSSGMYMRLAFAVAINVDADILLIDEILAVGDVSFQAKCFEKLKEIKRKGTTIVIVSHVSQQIQNICDRAIWIEDGLIKEDGKPKDVTTHYMKSMEEKRIEKIEDDFQREQLEKEERRKKDERAKEKKYNEGLIIPDFCTKVASRKGSMEVQFTDAIILDYVGKPAVFVETGEPFKICLKYKTEEVGKELNFAISITRDDGVYCYGTTALSGMRGKCTILSNKEGEVNLVIHENNLLSGKYLIDIGINGIDGCVFDYLYNALELRIKENNAQQGIIHMNRHWEVDGVEIQYEGSYKY